MPDTTFYERFSANMALLHLAAPKGLFDTAVRTVTSIGLIGRTIKEYGPNVTVGEVFRTLPAVTGVAVGGAAVAEMAAVAGTMLATFYLAACVGSLLVATGQTLAIANFAVLGDSLQLPGPWLVPAFAETSGRMLMRAA